MTSTIDPIASTDAKANPAPVPNVNSSSINGSPVQATAKEPLFPADFVCVLVSPASPNNMNVKKVYREECFQEYIRCVLSRTLKLEPTFKSTNCIIIGMSRRSSQIPSWISDVPNAKPESNP